MIALRAAEKPLRVEIFPEENFCRIARLHRSSRREAS